MIVVEEDVQIYESLSVLMAKLDDDEDKKVTVLYIKDNLKDYFPKELKSLANNLIDTICELINNKGSLNKNLDDFEVEKVDLVEKISKLQETCQFLSLKNDLLNRKISEISKSNLKEKSEGS